MGARSILERQLFWVVAAAFCAAGTWLYADRVVIPEQIAYAAAHGTLGGIHSDLYPRWVGARELLLHHRDPYTIEVTREIQKGFYGRVLDPDQPGATENYQQGFYYPVYVAFLLAPTLDLPFDIVRKVFFYVLLGLTVISVPLWLYVVRWRVSPWGKAAILGLMLGSIPIMQGLKLQQMTLLVVALLAGAMALLVANRQVPAGILLALATIKPQLVWLVLLWLAIWTMGDWRRRYRWLTSFLISMTILLAASEWYLPDWIGRFFQAMREYHNYTGEMSVMQLQMGYPWSRIVEVLTLAVAIGIGWRERREPAESNGFAFTLSLVLAVTVFIVPTYGPYNQALLVPALIMMFRERRAIWAKGLGSRVLIVITAGVFSWQWVWCMVLAALSFILPLAVVERWLQVPLWTLLLSPLAVVGVMLSCGLQRTFGVSMEPTTS